jgi:hypothetical protein
MQAQQRSDASAIGALAEHLGVATEDMHAWLRQPAGIPSQVLLSWIGLWHDGRPKGS